MSETEVLLEEELRKPKQRFTLYANIEFKKKLHLATKGSEELPAFVFSPFLCISVLFHSILGMCLWDWLPE